jgi:hypothetical protein
MQMSAKDRLMASLGKQAMWLVVLIAGMVVAVGLTIFLGALVGN